ncbi:hypothetical protein OROGR_031359 [Orobanche gracilis]
MENQRDSKSQKLKSLDGVSTPINALKLAYGRRRNSIFDPYASDSSDSPSPLMKYLRSTDTKSDSSPSFMTPVKVEEDVIVMDGIPVPKSNKGSGEVRMRSTLSSSSFNSNFVGVRSNSTSSSSSGGGTRGGRIENIKHHKNRLCRFWETCGTCQFGSECQFAHGKEELQRLSRSSGKIKLEIFKSNNNLEGSPSSSYGTKTPIQSKSPSSPAAAEESFPLPSLPTDMAFSTSPVQVKQLSGNTIPSSKIPTSPTRSEWTPVDDGIEVILPFGSTEVKNPSKEDVHAYIQNVLSGTSTRKRLPVFVEICPE